MSPPLTPPSTSALGTLTGIGIGPGDPELITVKALRALEAAPVVAYPQGRQGAPGLAQRIIAGYLRPDQQRLPLHFPYVVDPEQLQNAWDQAADCVWRVLQGGQDVVFACEGDLSFYGTFTYLAQALSAAHPEVIIRRVPGVCSPMAAASIVGLPLTVQADKLAVIPAFYSVSELEHTLDWADVVVLMKVSSVYSAVWQLLERRQLLNHSWVIVRASQPDQEIYRDLSQYPQLDLPYFALMVIRASPYSHLNSLG